MIIRCMNTIQNFVCNKRRHLYLYSNLTALCSAGIYFNNNNNNSSVKQTLSDKIGGMVRFCRTLRIGLLISADYYVSMLGLNETCPNYEVSMSLVHQRAANRILAGCLLNGGLYIKMGQGLVVLNHILPNEYLETLNVLYDQCLPRRKDEVVELFVEDFGLTPQQMFDEFQIEPIAAASLAQVFRAKTKEGLDVAIKVQYNDLQKRFNTDIATLNFLLKLIVIMHPTFNLTWAFAEVQDSLRQELDFVNEARNAEKCSKDLAHLDYVYVPKIIWDKTNTRVLTTEYVEAIKVNDVKTLRHYGYSLAEIDQKLFRIFGEQIFHTGFVHADPHPGNVMVRKDQNNKIQIVLLDHGLYNYLPSDYRLSLCNFWGSIVLNDHKNMQKFAWKLGVEDYKTLAEVLTQRPLNTNITLRSKLNGKELKYMLKLARNHFDRIVKTIRTMPPSLLLIIRNLNTIRSIARDHGDPINRFTALARIASYGRGSDSSMTIGKRILNCKSRTYFEFRLWFNNLQIWFIKFVFNILYLLGKLPDLTILTKQIS